MLILRFPFLWLGLILLHPLSVATGAVITTSNTVTVGLGSGVNVSYLVFDESSLSIVPIIYAWHYDGLTNPSTGTNWSGTDLINGVITDSAATSYALSYSTGAFGLISSFTIGTTTTAIDPLASPVWAYWVKGGSQYVPYGDNSDFTFNAPTTNWVVAPANFDTRWLTNGSYDGWTLSDYSYPGTNPISYYTDINGSNQPVTLGTYSGTAPLSGISAVPEPKAVSLLLPSLFILLLLIRWKPIAPKQIT